jgi:hypothetical protein
MTYMLLILEKHGDRENRTLEEGQALYAQMLQFGQSLADRGLLKGGDALISDSQGSRVTLKGGKRSVVDGPFAESREMIGGYFLVDCGSMAEAVAIAEECPAARWATVEVREIGTCFDTQK